MNFVTYLDSLEQLIPLYSRAQEIEEGGEIARNVNIGRTLGTSFLRVLSILAVGLIIDKDIDEFLQTDIA